MTELKKTPKPKTDVGSALIKNSAKVADLEQQVAALKAENSWLHAQLTRRRNVREQIRDTYLALDEAIIRRIDQRGKSRGNRQKTAAISQEVLQSTDKQTLMNAALGYDVRNFFRYRPRRSPTRLRYRVMSKTYRTMRDISLSGAKKAYRTARRIKG